MVLGDLHVWQVTYSTEKGREGIACQYTVSDDCDADLSVRLTNIPPQYILNLLRLESSLDYQPVTTIYRSYRSQLSKEILHDVVWLSMHPLANVDQIGKGSLLGSISSDLRRDNCVLLLVSREGWVVGSKCTKESAKELRGGRGTVR